MTPEIIKAVLAIPKILWQEFSAPGNIITDEEGRNITSLLNHPVVSLVLREEEGWSDLTVRGPINIIREDPNRDLVIFTATTRYNPKTDTNDIASSHVEMFRLLNAAAPVALAVAQMNLRFCEEAAKVADKDPKVALA